MDESIFEIYRIARVIKCALPDRYYMYHYILYLIVLKYSIESRFLKPRSKRSHNCFELLGGLRNRGLEKSGFYCSKYACILNIHCYILNVDLNSKMCVFNINNHRHENWRISGTHSIVIYVAVTLQEICSH